MVPKVQSIARNTFLNLAGQGLPLLVALATMPSVIRGLGPSRFGVLGLAWAALGYLSIFDLGLGRATTKFVAEALGNGAQERVGDLVWTTVLVQAAMGLVGTLVMLSATPLLVERILNVPLNLKRETTV